MKHKAEILLEIIDMKLRLTPDEPLSRLQQMATRIKDGEQTGVDKHVADFKLIIDWQEISEFFKSLDRKQLTSVIALLNIIVEKKVDGNRSLKIIQYAISDIIDKSPDISDHELNLLIIDLCSLITQLPITISRTFSIPLKRGVAVSSQDADSSINEEANHIPHKDAIKFLVEYHVNNPRCTKHIFELVKKMVENNVPLSESNLDAISSFRRPNDQDKISKFLSLLYKQTDIFKPISTPRPTEWSFSGFIDLLFGSYTPPVLLQTNQRAMNSLQGLLASQHIDNAIHFMEKLQPIALKALFRGANCQDNFDAVIEHGDILQTNIAQINSLLDHKVIQDTFYSFCARDPHTNRNHRY